MKMSFAKILVMYAVGISFFPVLALAVLVLAMNSRVTDIAEAEFGKISLNTARQVVGDTLKICQIISKSQTEYSDNARSLAFESLSSFGSPSLLETFYETDVKTSSSDSLKTRVPNMAFGKTILSSALDESSTVSSDVVKDALNSLKTETGMDFAVLVRINAQGDFLKIANTARDRYGREDVGEFISSESEISKTVLAKKTYSGTANSGDFEYIANYSPITDEAGEIVGALSYAKIQNSIDYILRYLEGVRLGANGYVWAIDTAHDGASVVRISREPSMRGAIIEKDMDGVRKNITLDIITSAMSLGENVVGVKEYHGAVAQSGGEIVAAYVYFKPWNMIFGATIYRADFEVGIEKIVSTAENFIFFLAPLGIGMLLFAGAAAYSAAARGREMVGELSASANLIEQGDICAARENLERTIKSNRWSNLEIYELSVSLMRMSGNLSKLVSKVKTGGDDLANSASQLAVGAAGIEELATAKADACRNVSAAIGSITNTVRLLKIGARVAAKNIEDTLSVLGNGAKLLDDLDQNAKDLMEATDSAASRLSIIKERIDRIAETISSINSVSGRINMLSINAAVEAEKARGLGVGFASVSVEIKKLAESISVSAMRISKIVSGIGGSVDSGIREMSKFSVKMRGNSEVIARVAQSIAAVKEQVSSLGPEFEKLAEGVELQAENAVDISRTMRDMSVSAAQTRNEIVEFKSAADSVAENAEDLKAKMARFNLGE